MGRVAEGWGWGHCLAAYRALEDNRSGAMPIAGGWPPVHLVEQARLHPLVKDYIAACAEAGLAENRNFNGAEQEGAGVYQMTIKGARRNSTARAFLRPAMKRANLRV